jgi:hypothetical protein
LRGIAFEPGLEQLCPDTRPRHQLILRHLPVHDRILPRAHGLHVPLAHVARCSRGPNSAFFAPLGKSSDMRRRSAEGSRPIGTVQYGSFRTSNLPIRTADFSRVTSSAAAGSCPCRRSVNEIIDRTMMPRPFLLSTHP